MKCARNIADVLAEDEDSSFEGDDVGEESETQTNVMNL
jgi:hypothetical protein